VSNFLPGLAKGLISAPVTVVERFSVIGKVVMNSGITRNFVLSVMIHALGGDQYAFRIGWT
jgi:hypothetical protein